MGKIFAPILITTSLLLASTALAAAPSTATGVIAAMDAKACTVTLVDKNVYQFAPKCDFSKLKAAEKVMITFTVAGKVNTATAIVPAK